MEKIKRPLQVSRAEKQVLTPKNEQKNTQEQFTVIYDYLDDVQESFDNIPQPPTIETITNNNGTATKFPDGTMICRKSVSFSNVAFPNQQGNLYFCPLLNLGDMPDKFAEPPMIFHTCPTASGLITGGRYYSITSFGHVQLYRGNNTTQETVTIEVMAIGKWK